MLRMRIPAGKEFQATITVAYGLALLTTAESSGNILLTQCHCLRRIETAVLEVEKCTYYLWYIVNYEIEFAGRCEDVTKGRN